MDGEIELLGERIAEQAAHLDAATHRLLADLREFDARGGWRSQGASSCAHWLSWRVGWDLVTARERVRVARKLGDFPVTDDSLRRGEVSYSKVRAILRVATPANEAMLLECARLSTASELEKLSHKYALVQAHGKDPSPRDDQVRRYVRRRDTSDGMVKIEAVLHPDEAEMVWAMLDHAAKQLAGEPAPRPPRGDSAESPAMSNDPVSRPPQRTASLAGDSAESLPAAVFDKSNEPAVSPRWAACPLDDSAESPPAWHCHAAASVRWPVCLCRDSAESSAVLDPGSGGSRPAACLSDDSAESPPAVEGSPVQMRPASSLRQAADAAKRAFNRADALLSITEAYLCGDRPNRRPIDVMITIPASNLRAAATDPTAVGCMGNTCISAEAGRRLGCDAGIIEVIEDEHGVPLSVGRKRRTVAGSIKRALLKRDTMCTYPGCTHRIFLEAHHVQHWADGGETSLQNTLLLCSHHHRFVHEYGYRIELGADQRPQFRDPRGWLVASVPARLAGLELGWPAIRAANAPLAIDSETIACEWDGKPMPYGAVVGQLVRLDGLT